MVTDNMHPTVDEDTSVCGDLDIMMDISFYNSTQYTHYLTFEFARVSLVWVWSRILWVWSHVVFYSLIASPGEK